VGGRRVSLLFTNVFIASLFTLMWLTVVCCSTAVSSSSSSSSSFSSSSSSSSSCTSSSKGFMPTGAVLVGTVSLAAWDTVRERLLHCTQTGRHADGARRHAYMLAYLIAYPANEFTSYSRGQGAKALWLCFTRWMTQ